MHIAEQIMDLVPKSFHVSIQDRCAYKHLKYLICFFIYLFFQEKLRKITIDFDLCKLSSSGDIISRNNGDINTSWLLIYLLIFF